MIAKLLYITFKTTQVNYLGFDFSFFFFYLLENLHFCMKKVQCEIVEK